MRLAELLPAPFANHANKWNCGRSAAPRLLFLPYDRHVGTTIAAGIRRVRKFAAIASFTVTTFFFVDAFAASVDDVRARILFVTRPQS